MSVDQQRDVHFMQQAISCAKQAEGYDEVPIGAVLVLEDKVISTGWNQPRQSVDPTAHAELIALRQGASKIDNYRLVDTTLYVTIEPCLMCAGALVHARIKRLVFGASEPKAGAIVSHPVLQSDWLNHRPEVTGGVCADECRSLMQNFFARRREGN